MQFSLMDRVAAGGTLILSGVLDGEVDLLKRFFPYGSFTLMEVSQEEGWACVVFKNA
jgi:ribosomal protein L11 methylase PrmA